jgi:hypothetical protein
MGLMGLLVTSGRCVDLALAQRHGGRCRRWWGARWRRRRQAGLVPVDQAEALARSITDGPIQAQALAALAPVIAGVNQDRAEQLARSMTDRQVQSQALVSVVARVDLDRGFISWHVMCGLVPCTDQVRSQSPLGRAAVR